MKHTELEFFIDLSRYMIPDLTQRVNDLIKSFLNIFFSLSGVNKPLVDMLNGEIKVSLGTDFMLLPAYAPSVSTQKGS
jgi:hypothetical protein